MSDHWDCPVTLRPVGRVWAGLPSEWDDGARPDISGSGLIARFLTLTSRWMARVSGPDDQHHGGSVGEDVTGDVR
jgi:hypothetical protein